jgi:hypothetical protein
MTPQRYTQYEDDPLVVTPKDEIAALVLSGEVTSTQVLYDVIRYLLTHPLYLKRLCFEVIAFDEYNQPSTFGEINYHPNIDMYVENDVMYCVDFPRQFEITYWHAPQVGIHNPNYLTIRTAYSNDAFPSIGPFHYIMGIYYAYPTPLTQMRIEPLTTLVKVRAKNANAEVRLRRSSDDENLEVFEPAPAGSNGHTHQKWIRSNCDAYLVELAGATITSSTRDKPQNLYNPNNLFNPNIIDLTQTHGYDYTRDASVIGTEDSRVIKAQFTTLMNITQQMQTVIDATLREQGEQTNVIS